MSDFLYCLNASTIRQAPVLQQIEIAGRAGYAAIELWHADIDAHLARGGSLSELQQALAHHRLQVPTTIYLKDWFDTTGDEHTAALAECRRRLEQAAALGAVHAIAGPPAGVADRARGAMAYRDLLELGLSLGVRPAMEFLGFVQDLCTIEAALDVVERAGHPAGSIVLDPFHIARGGGSLESVGRLAADQIAICHFNDVPATPPFNEQHDADRVWPGAGVFDLRRLLALLRGIGYRRWLSLELFREDLWQRDPFEVAREGLSRMRQVAESD